MNTLSNSNQILRAIVLEDLKLSQWEGKNWTFGYIRYV